MRYIPAIVLTALAFLIFWIIPSYADWPIDRMNEQIEKTNVIVGGVCSGTIIDKSERLVLTAYHCIDSQVTQETIEVVDPKTGEISKKVIQKRIPLEISVRKLVDYEIVGTNSHLVKIVGTDSKADIAILQVVDKDYIPEMVVPLASDAWVLKRGQIMYAVGNPNIAWDNSITQGIISAPQRTVDFGSGDFKMFQFSASVIGGNSGGSLLNENGELIGTVTGGVKGGPAFGIPISATKDLLRKSGFAKVLEVTVIPVSQSGGYPYGGLVH